MTEANKFYKFNIIWIAVCAGVFLLLAAGFITAGALTSEKVYYYVSPVFFAAVLFFGLTFISRIRKLVKAFEIKADTVIFRTASGAYKHARGELAAIAVVSRRGVMYHVRDSESSLRYMLASSNYSDNDIKSFLEFFDGIDIDDAQIEA